MTDLHQAQHNAPEDRIPRSALIPGLLGLIPFIVLSWSVIQPFGLISSPQALLMLNLYAALILTFIGALWWGLGARLAPSLIRNIMMVWSVIPALFAWYAMLLTPRAAQDALLGGFVVQWVMDSLLVYVGAGAMPGWAYRLRTVLTIIAVAAMTFTAWYIH